MRGALAGLLALAAVAAGAPARADTYLRQAVASEAFELFGRLWPAGRDTLDVWIGDGRLSVQGSMIGALCDFGAGRCLLLDHGARSYADLPLPLELSALLPGNDPPSATLRQLLGLFHPTARVTPSAEQGRVGPWEARRYDVEVESRLLTLRGEVWTTEEAAIDLAQYETQRRALLGLSPTTAAAAEALCALPGVVVREEAVLEGLGGRMRLQRATLEIRAADPPPGIYAPPPSYAPQPFDPLRALRR